MGGVPYSEDKFLLKEKKVSVIGIGKKSAYFYLTSSSHETRIVGYSNEPAALLPVFG